jgi:hypothetical protein
VNYGLPRFILLKIKGFFLNKPKIRGLTYKNNHILKTTIQMTKLAQGVHNIDAIYKQYKNKQRAKQMRKIKIQN